MTTTTSKLPPLANACDSHIHVFDSRFPAFDGSPMKSSDVNEYRTVQKRIGTSRTVIVTPRPYVTDNRCTLDAIAQLGIRSARGIAVLHPDVSDNELKKLHDGGIRGIRFTVNDPAVAVTSIDMIEPLAERIREFGWHVQLHMLADQIVEHVDLLWRLKVPIVFDHMGRLPPPSGTRHVAFGLMRRFLADGRAWVKLSGSILHDSSGRRPPKPEELLKVAQAFVAAAPDRCVWGSDWPHRGDKGVPDDVERFDALGIWAQDEATRRRILVDNPQALYGFANN